MTEIRLTEVRNQKSEVRVCPLFSIDTYNGWCTFANCPDSAWHGLPARENTAKMAVPQVTPFRIAILADFSGRDNRGLMGRTLNPSIVSILRSCHLVSTTNSTFGVIPLLFVRACWPKRFADQAGSLPASFSGSLWQPPVC